MMAGFAAGDPIDHYHGDGESVAEPSTISDSGQDVTMSDIAPNPQISVELDHQHDDRISSETGGEQGYQEVHQSRTAENLRFQQQLDYTEDQPGARKVVWPVESRENHRYNVIQAQHDLLEAQARRAPASDTTLSATAYQAYPDVAQLSVNQTPRFLIPNSVDHGFSFETNVARSSALYHNFQHQQGTFVPLTSPTTGASVHSYPADSTVTIPRSSVHPYLADPTVTIPRSSVHPYPADPTVTVPRRASTSNTGTQSSEPYPADPTLTLPRRASSSNTATQSSQVAPLNNSPVRASVHPLHPFPAPAINPGSTTDSTAHRAGTRKILIPRLASSSTKVLRTSGLSAGSSATGPHSTSSPAFDPTNSASAADQIYSSWPPASTRSPFVGKVPAHGTYSRLPATRSNEGPFVNAPAPQLYQPVAETQQRLFFNSGFGSTNQQHTSAAPADQVVIRWAPVAVPAPASNIQAHSSHIPANTVGSNQTPTAGGASNPVFKSPFVRAPGSCVSPLRSFSPSSTFGSDRIPTDSVLSQWTSTLSLNPANSTPNSDPNSMARNSAATRASGGSSSRRVLAPAPIDRSSYARARSNAPIPPLPQSSAPLFPQLPVNNNSISQVPVQELATRLAAMARDEGLDQPTPPSQWRSDDTSEWIPEHVEPVLPPAPANPVGDHDVLRLFWNHTRTNGQYWPVSHSSTKARMHIFANNEIALQSATSRQVWWADPQGDVRSNAKHRQQRQHGESMECGRRPNHLRWHAARRRMAGGQPAVHDPRSVGGRDQ